jgi:hypothetical protein
MRRTFFLPSSLFFASQLFLEGLGCSLAFPTHSRHRRRRYGTPLFAPPDAGTSPPPSDHAAAEEGPTAGRFWLRRALPPLHIHNHVAPEDGHMACWPIRSQRLSLSDPLWSAGAARSPPASPSIPPYSSCPSGAHVQGKVGLKVFHGAMSWSCLQFLPFQARLSWSCLQFLPFQFQARLTCSQGAAVSSTIGSKVNQLLAPAVLAILVLL